MVPRRFIGHRLRDLIGDDARTSFHQEILESPIVRERFAAASAVANPEDWVATRAWLGFSANEPSLADKRNSTAYASLQAVLPASANELIRQLADGVIVPSGAGRGNVQARARSLVSLVKSLEELSLTDQIGLLFHEDFASNEEDVEKRKWAAADLNSLKSAALALVNSGCVTLAEIIGSLRYRIATRVPLVDEDSDPRVKIMTLHSAKGLQGDNIVLAGIADQLIPGLEANERKREEQRRLLYVAVTRAKRRLVVSWPRAVPYEDAIKNMVRRDYVFTQNGKRYYKLASRCTLLPQAVGDFREGSAWLASARACECPRQTGAEPPTSAWHRARA